MRRTMHRTMHRIHADAARGILFLIAAASLTSGAAAMPPMGGEMKHIEVMLEDTSIHLMLEDPGPLTLQSYGEEYEGPAAVLNGTAFNSQYGWMAGGFWTLPPGGTVWVEQIDATPGLRCYEAMTFLPIFGTEGSSPLWQWSGIMVHNWYAASVPGAYEATYRVFVADRKGIPLPDYMPAEVTLTWIFDGVAGDLDGDGGVGASDLAILLGAWGTLDPRADLNGDGTVNAADLAQLLGAWG